MASAASADITALANALRTSGQMSDKTTFEVLQDAAQYILIEMEKRVPVDTGNLRGSLGIRTEPDRITIGPDASKAPYAGYVEFGTQPHEIHPKKEGGVLVFRVNGRTVYARTVNHPGTEAQPFVRDSFEQWVDTLGRMAAEANIQVIKREYER